MSVAARRSAACSSDSLAAACAAFHSRLASTPVTRKTPKTTAFLESRSSVWMGGNEQVVEDHSAEYRGKHRQPHAPDD
jgi:hypothetical protein